jgi:hypothetical protein
VSTTTLIIATDRTKYSITRLTDGKVSAADRFDPKSERSRRPVARAFGVADDWLLEAVEKVRVAGRALEFPVEDPLASEGPGVYLIRPIDATDDKARVVTCPPAELLSAHLPAVPLDHVVKWKGDADLCCLDVDYHTTKPPTRDWLSDVVHTRLAPKPAAWHFSRGGGLHLFYKKIDPFTADELAAVAALRFRSIDAAAGLELKTVVRGPGAEAVVPSGLDDTGGTVLGDWFGTDVVEEDARDEWLDSHDMVLGKRYGHSHCPINPTPGHDSKGEPVVVSDSGVYCHKCAGEGFTIGGRRPGFAPWAAVLGAPSAGDIGQMVRHIAHWGHARWVLTEKYNMPVLLAEKAYRAALKSYHHGRESFAKIPSAFAPQTDLIARVDDQWYSIRDAQSLPRDIQPLLATLPVCQRVVDGKVVKDAPSVSLYSLGLDFASRGYPRVECVHGFKIASHWLGPQAKHTQVGVPNRDLLSLSPRYVPRYVPTVRRMPEAEAWAVIETVVPRVSRTLIKLALCSFGSAQETRAGLLPITFVSGPSGTAKTSTLKVAAGVFGARTGDAVYDPDPTRFRQSLYEGAQRGPALLLNELLKDSGRGKKVINPKEALDPLLNLTNDSLTRLLYRDPVKFGRVPAVFITEPTCPPEVQRETQLARRIYHYRVHGSKDDWKLTIARARLQGGDLQLIRSASQAVNDACDAILSYVCDDFFAVPMTWDEQAEALGVHTIERSPDFEDNIDSLRHLFRLVCAAPDLEGSAAKRLGRGYKKVVPNANEEEDELSAVYRFWADGVGQAFLHSRKLEEKDWQKVLKADDDVRFDIRDDGVNVFVRFSRGPVKRPTHVNAELVDPDTLKPEE